MSNSQNNVDVVGVFTSGGVAVFEAASAMRVQIVRTSKTMQHPLEDGSTVTDHRIIELIEATLVLILTGADYRNIYGEIQSLFLKGDLLTVQSRVNSFDSMVISEMPHEETPDMMTAVTVIIKLKEARFFKSQYAAGRPIATANKGKSSVTVKRGEQAPSKPQASTAYRLLH